MTKQFAAIFLQWIGKKEIDGIFTAREPSGRQRAAPRDDYTGIIRWISVPLSMSYCKKIKVASLA